MPRSLRLLSLWPALLVCGTLAAQQSPAPPVAPAVPAPAVKPAEPPLPKLEGLRENIEFARVGEETLRLDAFVPPGDGPFATCILVHGGGFTKGTKRSYITPIFEPLAKAGFVWFTIDYRLAPKHRWPACADDVATAIRWVKEHAAEYKVDPNRIALIGESAGGHLVSYAGVKGEGATRVAAVVPFYAPHDLESQVRRRGKLGDGPAGLLGTNELDDAAYARLKEISASTYVTEKLPPFLLIHGDKDEQVPFEQSEKFRAKMLAAGNVCELLTIPGGAHGMGGWDKLGSDYKVRLVDWLKEHLK